MDKTEMDKTEMENRQHLMKVFEGVEERQGEVVRVEPKVVKLDMYAYCARKNDRSFFANLLMGVYHDGAHRVAVATDGFVLVAWRGGYNERMSGRMVFRDGGVEEVDLRQPCYHWDRLMGQHRRVSCCFRVDVGGLSRFVCGVRRCVGRGWVADCTWVMVLSNGFVRVFRLYVLERALSAARCLGLPSLEGDGDRLHALSGVMRGEGDDVTGAVFAMPLDVLGDGEYDDRAGCKVSVFAYRENGDGGVDFLGLLDGALVLFR